MADSDVDNIPGQCPYDLHSFVMGKSTKTLCGWRGREIWTTCQDWGKCTFQKSQMSLFDEDDEDDEFSDESEDDDFD